RTHLLDFAEAGHALALLSDAGTPLVSDPGFKLVRAALARDLAVRAIPGASAALCALIQSGLPCHKFTFYGFIPRKPGAWDQMAEQLDRDTGTAILFEAARNIGKTLERMARRWPGRTAMLARELTKRNETCWHAELARLNARWCEQGIARGEITLVLGPITPSNLPAADKERSMAIAKILADAHTKNLSVRDRTKQLMDECNLPRRDAYQLALQSVQN
ncbi:MAG: SAM-dependent methyltransferase, partial [Pseudomonadota bacterium]